MISQFFVLSQRGDNIVFRDYRGEVPKGSAEIFFRKVKFWKEDGEGDAPPVFNVDGVNYFHVKVAGLLFVATTRVNVSPSLVLELLQRIARVIKDYLGILNEDSLRKNFVLVYELLDEVIDFGYVKTTSTEVLKSYIFNEPIVIDAARVPSLGAAGIFMQGSKRRMPGTAVTKSVVANEPGGRKREEIFVDIIEKISVTFSSSGYILTSEIDGTIQMKSYLSGNPEIRLALNDDLSIGRGRSSIYDYGNSSGSGSVILDDCNFHESVHLDNFDIDRTLALVPPDGEFPVMMTQEFRTPFRINALIEEAGPLKAEVILKVRAEFASSITANTILVQMPLPTYTTRDGRIKVIGGDGIEGLLISPKQLPYKHIEFLQNKAYMVSISNDNDIQVWDLVSRSIADSLQWASNITAFSVISGSHFMYVGDEHGLMSVIKFEAEDGKLFQLQYHISAGSISEAAGFPLPNDQPIIGVLPQPCSSGNRVLLAYQNGLIILWDISEGQILFVGGGKDLQLKDGVVDSSSEVDANLPDATLEHHHEDKEISALCWASSSGSILAVGYIDGDILFWNTSCAASSKSQQASSSNNIVKLQLSSAERRLPVIVLQWSKNQKSRNDCDGQLFIYGGDEIGSEEVLTVVSLEWSTGTLRCVGRAELTLSGSFADMILLPNAGAMGGNQKADLFVLTNPGQLHFYDDASLSALISQRERRPSISAMEFPAVVPSSNPSMTVSKLSKIPTGGDSSKALLEVASVMKLTSTVTAVSAAKWPLTGGLRSELSITKNDGVGRIYLAGYSDGSIRIWDATYPVLSLICLLEGEVQGVKVAGSSAPVTKLDFCSISLRLAVGNGCGLVRLYDLKGCSDGTHFHFVTETKNEVYILPQGKGPQCRAVFCLLNSPIQALQFANCGAKLAVGFESGRVAVLNTSSSSVLFWIDGVSCSSFPIISITWKELTYTHSLAKSPKHFETKVPAYSAEEVIFVLTKDAKINLFEGGTGKIISTQPWHLKKPSVAISMYVIAVSISVSESSNEMQLESHEDRATKNEPMPNSTTVSINSHEGEQQPSSETACSEERLLDSILLLCCEDSLHLYSTKSVIQGNNKSIRKVKHAKPCCWTATLKKDEKVCGLVLLFQTGVIEIRSLPDLELVKESSLMSILRWNFKANMDKTMSSSDNGQITLASGCELAFISLLAGENDFRIPETLPCLHDEVLAAAADAALNFSLNPKNKQGTEPGILGGIVKGFKGRKVPHTEDFIPNPKVNFSHLEGIFLKSPFSDSSPAVTDNQEAEELNIDDIEIDEPLPAASSSSHDFQNIKTEKGTERERLFQGGTDDTKPRLRTPEEIMATYRKAGDASSVAAHARDKLAQRQEKLEKISRRTEELQSGAEDFASLANELVKTLEARKKWWHI